MTAAASIDPKQWIGKTERVDDTVTATPYGALSATLDHAAGRPSDGTSLPPLWHWLYFLPLYRHSDGGPDGHAKRGDFLPPVPLPRRMWAGSQLAFHAALRIGDRIHRISTIADVTEKAGRTGPLVFVKVRHEITAGGEEAPAIVEFQDIVYREAAKAEGTAPPIKSAPSRARWHKRWLPDDVLLFRYSALTFNSHRIHYDRRYATEMEGYPGLVVHGPLIATLLLDLVHAEAPGTIVRRYEFRATHPLFDIHPFDVCGEPSADGRSVQLWAKDHRGALAMEATAQIA